MKQIQNPEQCWEGEQALVMLKLWKRRIERAKELKVAIPDPSILLKALDAITSEEIKGDRIELKAQEKILELTQSPQWKQSTNLHC